MDYNNNINTKNNIVSYFKETSCKLKNVLSPNLKRIISRKMNKLTKPNKNISKDPKYISQDKWWNQYKMMKMKNINLKVPTCSKKSSSLLLPANTTNPRTPILLKILFATKKNHLAKRIICLTMNLLMYRSGSSLTMEVFRKWVLKKL